MAARALDGDAYMLHLYARRLFSPLRLSRLYVAFRNAQRNRVFS